MSVYLTGDYSYGGQSPSFFLQFRSLIVYNCWMAAYYQELRKFFVPEILFGCGAIFSTPGYIRNLGGGHVLLVSDRGVEQTGWTRDLEELLTDSGIGFTTFYDISPNPRDYEVQNGLETYLKAGCDMIVALGGGSPLDCAKGIGILVSNRGSIGEYEGADNIPVPIPPLICIPTTAGSSADVSQFAIITNSAERYKMAIISKSIVPDISLIDPSLSVTMGPGLTAETGLDALTHAVESFVSNASGPMTDINAAQAIRGIRRHLPLAVAEPGNIEARSEMMLCSMHAGLAFSNASLGLVHSMAHALGGLVDLPHGLCNGLLLEHVADYNFTAAPGKYREVAEIFTGTDTSSLGDAEVRKLLKRELSAFREKLSVSGRLPAGAADPHDLAGLVNTALNDACIVTNPRQPEFEDILGIYEKIIG